MSTKDEQAPRGLKHAIRMIFSPTYRTAVYRKRAADEQARLRKAHEKWAAHMLSCERRGICVIHDRSILEWREPR